MLQYAVFDFYSIPNEYGNRNLSLQCTWALVPLGIGASLCLGAVLVVVGALCGERPFRHYVSSQNDRLSLLS